MNKKEEQIVREFAKQLYSIGMTEEYRDIIVECCKKLEELDNKVFGVRKCQICNAPATQIIAPAPFQPSDMEDDESIKRAMARQLYPKIYICDNHSDEELQERFPWIYTCDNTSFWRVSFQASR
jgi:hypothetical protein